MRAAAHFVPLQLGAAIASATLGEARILFSFALLISTVDEATISPPVGASVEEACIQRAGISTSVAPTISSAVETRISTSVRPSVCASIGKPENEGTSGSSRDGN